MIQFAQRPKVTVQGEPCKTLIKLAVDERTDVSTEWLSQEMSNSMCVPVNLMKHVFSLSGPIAEERRQPNYADPESACERC